MKSVPNRTQDEKLVKDICDIYALGWYSGKNFQKIKNASRKHLNHEDSTKLQMRLKSEKNMFKKAQTAMDINATTIQNLIEELEDLIETYL